MRSRKHSLLFASVYSLMLGVREILLDEAMSLLKMTAKFRPGTVFTSPSGGVQQGYSEYVAISHPFPHPDIPSFHQIWAVPTERDGYYRDAPKPELLDIRKDTYPTLFGWIVTELFTALLGAAVLGGLAATAYLIIVGGFQ